MEAHEEGGFLVIRSGRSSYVRFGISSVGSL